MIAEDQPAVDAWLKATKEASEGNSESLKRLFDYNDWGWCSYITPYDVVVRMLKYVAVISIYLLSFYLSVDLVTPEDWIPTSQLLRGLSPTIIGTSFVMLSMGSDRVWAWINKS